MLIDPYGALICSVYNKANIVNEITNVAIRYPLPQLVTPLGRIVPGCFFVPPIDEYDNSVAGFTQFVNINTMRHGKKEKQTVIDGRKLFRFDRRTEEFVVTSSNDLLFHIIRLVLTKELEENGSSSLARYSDVPMATFIRWITVGISTRFNIDLASQMNVSIIAALYFLTQLQDGNRELIFNSGVKNNEEAEKYAILIANKLKVPGTKVLEITDQMTEDMVNPNRFVEAISKYSGSMRLDGLKFIDLFNILSSSWFGTNHRENVGLSLEHIPTFMSMVYMAAHERSYRRTIITQRLEAANKRPEIASYEKAIQIVVDKHID